MAFLSVHRLPRRCETRRYSRYWFIWFVSTVLLLIGGLGHCGVLWLFSLSLERLHCWCIRRAHFGERLRHDEAGMGLIKEHAWLSGSV